MGTTGVVSILWRGLSLMAYAWTWLCVVADQRDRDRLALEAAGIRRHPARAW